MPVPRNEFSIQHCTGIINNKVWKTTQVTDVTLCISRYRAADYPI